MSDRVFNGGKLYTLRTGLNLSQRQLANHLKKSGLKRTIPGIQGAISEWERGKTRPNVANVSALANYFEIPIEDFYVTIESKLPSKSKTSPVRKLSPKSDAQAIGQSVAERLIAAEKAEPSLHLTIVGKFYDKPDLIAQDEHGMLYKVVPLT